MALGSLPAALLLDFAQASPSFARRWMWLVWERLGVCLGLRRVIEGLYRDLRTMVFHQGCFLALFALAAGIKQGYPLSGSLFALAADGLIRASLAATTLRSAWISVFAGDVAFVVYRLGRAFGWQSCVACPMAVGNGVSPQGADMRSFHGQDWMRAGLPEGTRRAWRGQRHAEALCAGRGGRSEGVTQPLPCVECMGKGRLVRPGEVGGVRGDLASRHAQAGCLRRP